MSTEAQIYALIPLCLCALVAINPFNLCNPWLLFGASYFSYRDTTCDIRHTIYDIRRPGLNRLYTKYYRLTTNWPSTSVERALQISSFLQNKPNFRKSPNEHNLLSNNELRT